MFERVYHIMYESNLGPSGNVREEDERKLQRQKIVHEIETLKRQLKIVQVYHQEPDRPSNNDSAATYGLEKPVKPLMILDLNKVLICRQTTTQFTVRPYAIEFITHMSSVYKLAIWTSMTSRVAKQIISELFPVAISKNFLFRWYQSKCSSVPSAASAVDKDAKPLFLKNLYFVWEEFLLYDHTNTVLIDDSREKCALNPVYTSVHPLPYDFVYPDNKPDAAEITGASATREYGESKSNRVQLEAIDVTLETKIGIGEVPYLSETKVDDNDEELKPLGPLWCYLTALSDYITSKNGGEVAEKGGVGIGGSESSCGGSSGVSSSGISGGVSSSPNKGEVRKRGRESEDGAFLGASSERNIQERGEERGMRGLPGYFRLFGPYKHREPLTFDSSGSVTSIDCKQEKELKNI